tara:strand:- start:281 stop:535 length:255 start_codon:yes stop_codon:yes gene_type:complete
MMQLRYFGWVRSRIGISKEEISLPTHIDSVALLIEFLKNRGDGYLQAFEEVENIRAAVNQEIAPHETKIFEGDEVALFPPMTGG